MRLDKYLKVSRILKRRVVSKQLAQNERILVNDKIAKPSYDIKPTDIITVIFGNRLMKVKVLETKEFSKKEQSSLMYEILQEGFVNNEIEVNTQTN